LLHKQKRKKEKVKQPEEKKGKHYRGTYKNLSYESCLEFALLLHCEELGLRVRNFDLDPIDYYDPTRDQNRKYYPDYIVEDFLICEVKWLGFVWKKKKAEIRSKRQALEYFCCANPKYASLFVTNNMIKKRFVHLAKKLHEEKYGNVPQEVSEPEPVQRRRRRRR
jgi:hypothetical protein